MNHSNVTTTATFKSKMTAWSLILVVLVTVLEMRTSLVSGLVIVPAVGRTARIGELYDAFTDSFRDVTIFQKEWNSSIVATLDTPLSEVNQMKVSKLRDKANLLRVSATITIGIYSGLIELSGTAEYLREEKQTSSEQSQVFSYSVRTKRDVLEDYGYDLREFISADALNIEATHVVTAVDYGADVFIEFNAKNVNQTKEEKIYGELALYFRKFEAIANAKAFASVKYETFDKKIDEGLSIRIFGDLAIKNQYPLTLSEVADFLRTVPGLIHQKNGAKGNPISYTIAPIEQFREKFGANLLSTRRASSVNETQSYEFLLIFEEIEDVRARMNEMSEKFRINEDFIPYKNITNLEELQFLFEDAVLSLKKNVAAGLILTRVGNDTAMMDFKKEYEANPHSAAKVSEMLRTDYEPAMEKTVEIENFRKHDIEVLGRSGSVSDILLKYPDRIIQILFMTQSYKSDNKWASTVALLLRPLKNLLNKLVMVDCSFNSTFCPKNSVIKQFYNGKELSEDVFRDHGQVSGSTLQMAGTGTENKLGDLFDIRTGKFTGTTVLEYFDPNSEFEDEITTFEYSHFTPQNFKDIVNNLRIPMWQGANMMASGETILDFQRASKSFTGYMTFIRRNSTRTLSLTARPTFVETDTIFQKEVTHYVSSMEVATIDIFAFQIDQVNAGDQASIILALKEDMAKFEKLFQSFQQSGEDITKLEMSLKYSKIQIFTNYGEFPAEFETLASFLEHLSKMDETDELVSLPIRYTLQPVSVLHEPLQFFIPVPRYREISVEVAEEVVMVYDQIQSVSSQLQEFRTIFQNYHQVARDEDYKKFFDMSLHLDNETEYWKAEIFSVLQRVRFDEEEEEALTNYISLFWDGDVGSLSSVYWQKHLPLLSTKLSYAVKAHGLGIRYLGRGNWYQEIFMGQRVNVSVAMVKFARLNLESMLELWLGRANGASAFIVDCDFFIEECSEIADFEEREYSFGILKKDRLQLSLQEQVKEVQIQVNGLEQRLDFFFRNLTRHYHVLEDFTDHFLE